MKRIIILLTILLLLISCGLFSGIYKYSYIKPVKQKANYQTYTIQKVDISNPEVILLDKDVISNSICNVINIVMKNNGFTAAASGVPGDMAVQIGIYAEDNDIMNNKQSISLFFNFNDSNSSIANFMLSSKNKDLLLDKETLIRELNSILSDIKNL
jgi:hypothetical protein